MVFLSRLWGVRHLRYVWLRFRFELWWARVGHMFGAFPNPADLEFLDAVWRGEA